MPQRIQRSAFPSRRAARTLPRALLACTLAGCASVAESSAPAPAPVNPPQDPVAAQSPDPQPSAVGGEDARAHFTGFVSARLLARFAGGEHDADLVGLVSVDYSDPRRAWIRAHATARLALDLDGSSPGSPFDGLSDLYDQALEARLYDAYVDLEPPDGIGRLRVGRQYEALSPETVHFDGLAFHTEPAGPSELSAGFYGGAPVHLYEAREEGESLLGSFVEARPWAHARARLDWMHLDDTALLGPVAADLFGLGLWQRFEGGLAAEGQYTRLGDEDRDLRLRGEYQAEDGSLALRATYYQLFQTQNELPDVIDPYSAVLQEYFPYRQGGLSLTSELGHDVALDLGADLRRVDDADDVGEFNRDWERYRIGLAFRDAFTRGLTLTLSADQWDGDERDIGTWGANLDYQDEGAWRYSAGSYYSLYKYDLYSNSERDDVRTYYARAVYKVGPQLSFELGYDYEDDVFEQYHILRGGALWRF